MFLQRKVDGSEQLRECAWVPRACPLCFEARPPVDLGTRVYDVATRHQRFKFVLNDCVCQGCGFAMARSVPDDRFLSDYYADAFLRVKPDASMPPGYDTAFRLETLKAFLGAGARVLEVGAGDGAFVESLTAAGVSAKGVDLVDHNNIGAVACTAFDAASNEGTAVDAVVNYYVLEHIADPRQFLANCKSWLRVGGVLVIEVPNLETHPEAALNSEHLSYFTMDTLKALVESCGFGVVRQEARASRYFGQTLVARLEDGSRNAKVPALAEEAAAEVVARVRSLMMEASEAVDRRRQAAQRLIAQIMRDQGGRPFDLIAWGANPIATEIGLAASQAGIRRRSIVDQSDSKAGHLHDGFEEAIRLPVFDETAERHRAVLVCSEAWQDDIRKRIEAMNLVDISIYSAFQGISK
jgi:SAM-dependent methyltransferase